jgi:hypothetical protein
VLCGDNGVISGRFAVSRHTETEIAVKIRRIPRRNRHYSGETPKVRKPADCLAGTAVRYAPCSAEIPCKQGILQGISTYRRPGGADRVQKSAIFKSFAAQFPRRSNREFLVEKQETFEKYPARQAIPSRKRVRCALTASGFVSAIMSRSPSSEFGPQLLGGQRRSPHQTFL